MLRQSSGLAWIWSQQSTSGSAPAASAQVRRRAQGGGGGRRGRRPHAVAALPASTDDPRPARRRTRCCAERVRSTRPFLLGDREVRWPRDGVRVALGRRPLLSKEGVTWVHISCFQLGDGLRGDGRRPFMPGNSVFSLRTPRRGNLIAVKNLCWAEAPRGRDGTPLSCPGTPGIQGTRRSCPAASRARAELLLDDTQHREVGGGARGGRRAAQ